MSLRWSLLGGRGSKGLGHSAHGLADFALVTKVSRGRGTHCRHCSCRSRLPWMSAAQDASGQSHWSQQVAGAARGAAQASERFSHARPASHGEGLHVSRLSQRESRPTQPGLRGAAGPRPDRRRAVSRARTPLRSAVRAAQRRPLVAGGHADAPRAAMAAGCVTPSLPSRFDFLSKNPFCR